MELTANFFKLPTVGKYTYNGETFSVTERISNYGSGKKTVYTIVRTNGETYSRRDILQVKRIFGLIAGNTKKDAQPQPAPVPQPEKEAPQPQPQPQKDSAAAVLHKDFGLIVAALKRGENVYMFGPAGTGKSYLAKQAADILGVEYYEANAVQDPFDLTGYKDATGNYQPTQFYKAYTEGGIFLFDEFDASNAAALTVFNNMLANDYGSFPCGRVAKHPNFMCIAAGNTAGNGANEEYVTRSVIDAATLNRFSTKVIVNYDRRIEAAICKDNTDIVEFAHALRRAAKAAGVPFLFTYRNIKALYLYERDGQSKADALRLNVVNGMTEDTARALYSNIATEAQNNPYYKAMKQAIKDAFND